MSQKARTYLWRPAALSLGTLLVLAVLLPFLGAVGLTGWYGITLLERHTQARMEEDIELIARAIRLPLSHAMERGYDRTVERALESAFSIDRVYGIYLYDREGQPVYSNGAVEASMPHNRAASLASRGERQGEFGRAGKERVFSYFVPLVDAGERINGLLQITRRGSDFDRYIAELRRQSLTIVTVAAGALILIVLLGHRWAVGRHLRRMEQSLARIGSGEIGHRLERRGPRELSLLSAAVNQMLDAIVASRRKLARQKTREEVLTARLHQSEKLAALGQLAAGVAHELGSPLATVDGSTQRALRHQDAPEGVQRALAVIKREASRMERIIRQLLDFGRANPLSLRELPAEYPLRSALQTLGREHGPRLICQVDPAAERQTVAVDLVRLEQALNNLLRNAVQAARSQVRIRCAVENGELCYTIEDDGPGIHPEAADHLFEPFFTTKPTGSGTGLGLAVAHAAVRDHGGEIEVGRSELGGALFLVRLPLAAPQGGEHSEIANE
ncbi:ATP-binding protein [Gilvimarinus sp. F26214L]|uniref:ATP-binding protein n=1 Tax=Gilvimarinus sp. DZF01 TaxID=3461371 RepID=UPI004045FBB9